MRALIPTEVKCLHPLTQPKESHVGDSITHQNTISESWVRAHIYWQHGGLKPEGGSPLLETKPKSPQTQINDPATSGLQASVGENFPATNA